MKEKKMTDDFENHILQEFKTYCLQNQLEADFRELTTFLLDEGFIEGTKIKRYIVRKSVKFFIHTGTTKTAAVSQTSNKYDINTRTIWNLIREK